MDGQRFDNLTKALASGASRRRVLKGLVGGIAGGLAAAFGRHRVGAQTCGDIDDACFSDGDCCRDAWTPRHDILALPHFR